MGTKNNLLGKFGEKHKLSLRSVRSGQEIWHVFISRAGMTGVLAASVVVIFAAAVLVMAYTPLLDFLPGYPGAKSRETLIRNIAKLDSLQNEVGKWQQYHHDFALILDGRQVEHTADTATRQSVGGEITLRNRMDSILRAEMTDPNSPYRLETREQVRRYVPTFEMIPPVKGMIVNRFAPGRGFNGIELAPAPNQEILAVMDGTVIQTCWDPAQGNTVVVQQSGGFISVYKNVGASLRRTGDRVKAGEVIALSGQVTDTKIPHVIFELWLSGVAVDPERYITFQ